MDKSRARLLAACISRASKLVRPLVEMSCLFWDEAGDMLPEKALKMRILGQNVEPESTQSGQLQGHSQTQNDMAGY